MQDRLARVRSVLHPGQARDRRGGAAGLMRGQTTELHRRHDPVAGCPRPLAPLDASIVTGADEPLLVRRHPLDTRAENARNREDALNVESLAARLQDKLSWDRGAPRRRSSAPPPRAGARRCRRCSAPWPKSDNGSALRCDDGHAGRRRGPRPSLLWRVRAPARRRAAATLRRAARRSPAAWCTPRRCRATARGSRPSRRRATTSWRLQGPPPRGRREPRGAALNDRSRPSCSRTSPPPSSTSTTASMTSSALVSSANRDNGTRCACPNANGSATANGR